MIFKKASYDPFKDSLINKVKKWHFFKKIIFCNIHVFNIYIFGQLNVSLLKKVLHFTKNNIDLPQTFLQYTDCEKLER